MTETMAVLIAGPTASGKSSLAMDVAKARGGVVINADAMQVYGDLRVLTARPSDDDEAAVPHALYGHVDAAAPYSVGAWLRDVEAALAAARAAGRLPVIVGGTGMYLAALTEGLSPVPTVPEAVRAHYRAMQASVPAAALHAALAARDPVMAQRLRPSDPQRIVRALEVIDGTGRSLAEWQGAKDTAALPLGPGVTAVRLAPERAAVREAIALRFAAMMRAGAMDEVAGLAARGLGPELPAMKAIGVPPLLALLRGETGREAAVERAITDSRQFAKRQDTWLRGRFGHWASAPPQEARALLGI